MLKISVVKFVSGLWNISNYYGLVQHLIRVYVYRVKRKHKRTIRRILEDAELGEQTKQKIAIEKVFIFLVKNLIEAVVIF